MRPSRGRSRLARPRSKTIAEQVGALLTASEDGEGFAKRYFESLQRQPAVVLAHADVRQALKAMRAQA